MSDLRNKIEKKKKGTKNRCMPLVVYNRLIFFVLQSFHYEYFISAVVVSTQALN